MNIPNALSVFRMFLIPCFVVAFFSDLQYAYLWAAVIFVVAGVTDIVDGYIARKYNQVTMLGRLLDPLADKLMVFAALICITIEKLIPVWGAVVFFAKEITQGLGGLLLYRRVRDVPPSNRIGKLGTTIFYVTIVLIILFDISYRWKIAMLSVSFAVIFAAFFTYTQNGLRLANAEKEGLSQAKELNQ